MKSGNLEYAERDVMPAQDAVDFRRMPRGIAQLECVLMAGRQDFEERIEPLHVYFPPRRKLEYDGPQFLPKAIQALEEFGHSGFRVLQLLHMRQEPAALGREAEVLRC